MERVISETIAGILKERKGLLEIAIRQRAKFEGWLKFELASRLDSYGMKNVEVESVREFRRDRVDISFFYQDNPYRVELKTPNTNWKIEGIDNVKRPITRNINSIIEDTFKLNSQYGIVAFVLFPIPTGDKRWKRYLSRIVEETEIKLSADNNCTTIEHHYGDEASCDLVVCTYKSKKYRAI